MRVTLEYEPGIFQPLYQIHDLLRHVLDYVEPETLVANVQLGNKLFHALSNEEELWKHNCIQMGYDERLNELNHSDDGYYLKKEEGSPGFFKKLYLHLLFKDERENDGSPENDEATYFVEHAKSGRSSCRSCGLYIKDKQLRLGVTTRTEEEYYSTTGYYHWECGIRTHSEHILDFHQIDGYEIVRGKDRKLLEEVVEEKKEEKRRRYEEMFPPTLQAYTCDKCLTLCADVVYHCQDCKDPFDLCQSCFEKSNDDQTIHDPDHAFVLDDSIQSLSCDLCDNKISEALFHCRYCDCFDLCQDCALKAQKGETLKENKHDMTHPFIYVGFSEKMETSNRNKQEESNKRKLHPEEDNEIPAAKRRKVISLRGLLNSYGVGLDK